MRGRVRQHRFMNVEKCACAVGWWLGQADGGGHISSGEMYDEEGKTSGRGRAMHVFRPETDKAFQRGGREDRLRKRVTS